MNTVVKFFHQLFNPHCQHCMQLDNQVMENAIVAQEIQERLAEENKRCRSCESLERQLAVANDQIIKLTEKIVNPNPQPMVQIAETTQRPLNRGPLRFTPELRRTLEAESRAKAAALKQAAQPDSQVSQNNEPKVESPAVAENKEDSLAALEQLVVNARTERESATGETQSEPITQAL